MPDIIRTEVLCSSYHNGPYTRKVCSSGCIGCHKCEKTCPQGAITVDNFLARIDWDKCTACGECAKVCPTGATYQTEDGQVLVNKEKCIGCKMCMAACPYGARSYNPEAKVVEKCTLCHHLQEVGDQPACVKVCCAKARFFGDVDDPESDVSKVLAAAGTENVHSMPDSGNHPTVRYILHKKTGEWQVNPPKMVEN